MTCFRRAIANQIFPGEFSLCCFDQFWALEKPFPVLFNHKFTAQSAPHYKLIAPLRRSADVHRAIWYPVFVFVQNFWHFSFLQRAWLTLRSSGTARFCAAPFSFLR